jgi:hypothetical protein
MSRLRIITWNCRIGGFRWKAAHIAPLGPDILAVQEVSLRDEVLQFAGEPRPTCAHREPAGVRGRGVGVYSYTDTVLAPLGTADGNFGFTRYAGDLAGVDFHVAAVWTYPTVDKERTYGQALQGIRTHAKWIAEKPTIILGDFNSNASWPKSMIPEVCDLLEPLGLVSAYHVFFNEDFGHETLPTWYQYGHQDASAYMLDYCFLPREWTKTMGVQVGAHEDWCARKLSDHVPLMVDVDL